MILLPFHSCENGELEMARTVPWFVNHLKIRWARRQPAQKSRQVSIVSIVRGKESQRVSDCCTVGRHQATLKKSFVSCPAGGRNYGHSGGRKFF